MNVALPSIDTTTSEVVDTSRSYGGVCDRYLPLVKEYGWNIDTAMAVMKAESNCRADAYNGHNYDGSNDAGLFQINSIHVRSGLIGDNDRLDPAKNVAAAYAIYRGSGWNAWSVCHTKISCY